MGFTNRNYQGHELEKEVMNENANQMEKTPFVSKLDHVNLSSSEHVTSDKETDLSNGFPIELSPISFKSSTEFFFRILWRSESDKNLHRPNVDDQ
jgi:hypothetical protein